MSQKDAKIGIVGGAGPYAGLDLAQKILHQTVANSDQDYLPTLLISTPGLIEDRTNFLLGQTASFHSINRLTQHLKGLGHKAPKGVVADYVQWLLVKDDFPKKVFIVKDGEKRSLKFSMSPIYNKDELLEKLFPNGRALFIPIDHATTSFPEKGLEDLFK